MSTYIIAESATNHNGDIGIAKEMVWAAKESGADFIKFQSWQIRNMDSHNPAYSNMRSKELSDDDHYVLIEECRKAGIRFLTTCFDINRIEFLASLGLDTIKVASTDVTSLRMLNLLRQKFPTVIISTGMAYASEVQQAVDILRRGMFYLLHCVSLYPCPPQKANLLRMNWLRQFTEYVGYSDHVAGNEASIAAITLGAKIIEKHFTLKRDPSNIFSAMSALPHDIKTICDFAHIFESMLGEGEVELWEEEKESRKKFIGRWGDNR